MITVLSLMEDKFAFNNLTFTKTKICNSLIENLALCIHMFGQSFLQCTIFDMMKLQGFASQRNINMP